MTDHLIYDPDVESWALCDCDLGNDHDLYGNYFPDEDSE